MTEEEVVQEIQRRCWRLGVSVLFSPKESVLADGCHCSGYFDGEPETPVLVIAWGMPKERRLGILLHEYCHATQHFEGQALFAKAEQDYTPWFAGKHLKNAQEVLATSRDMEEDCERRTLRLIAELDAPVDVEEYTRAANAYLHGYNSMYDERSWFKVSPYKAPEVVAACNSTLDKSFKTTPAALKKILKKHCF